MESIFLLFGCYGDERGLIESYQIVVGLKTSGVEVRRGDIEDRQAFYEGIALDWYSLMSENIPQGVIRGVNGRMFDNGRSIKQISPLERNYVILFNETIQGVLRSKRTFLSCLS